jgi:hypothetical protein
MPKRLFDIHDITTLFAKSWDLLTANERITRKYGTEKLIWEVTTRKAESEGRRPEAC